MAENDPEVLEQRAEVAFKENAARLRSLDEMMWKVPTIAMTLTGGAWFGAAKDGGTFQVLQIGLLVLAAAGNIAFIIVLRRVRQIIQVHLQKIEAYDPTSFPIVSSGNRVIVRAFSTVLGLACIFSIIGVFIVSGAHLCAPEEPNRLPSARTPEFEMKLSPFLDESQWVDENRSAFVVRDRHPVTPGHTLIVPKRKVQSVFDLSLRELADCWELVVSEKESLRVEYSADGFNIGVNDGPAAGQTIGHAHIHLIPRHLGDNPNPRGGVRAVIPGKADYPAD